MKSLLVLGITLIVSIELLVLISQDRRFVLTAAGAGLALVLLNVRRILGNSDASAEGPDTDDVGEGLRRWLAGTETTIRRAESTRAEWDRHLRPVLAQRFVMSTGQRPATDPAAFAASGELLVGPQLWEWVDPNRVARAGTDAGPGRDALEEILRRLDTL
ncbi:hypothetical protein [Mycobacterium sp.]|uniref:hypothetical protein n=1 Tax=Mycobacterium sp. TaxID=1785 RepID=UPI003A86D2BF